VPPPVTPVPGVQLTDLQTLSCGRVNVEARGGQCVLSGYVATDDDLKQVKLIAANVPNTSLGNVIVTPWPQCEALQTLEKPLQIADRPTIDIGPTTELRGGDPLRIRVGSPAQISYLYVSYIQADGSVVHLVQPNGLLPQPTLPRQTLMLGSGENGNPKFTVGPPFGREMIIAIASRSPLFDHELPAQQTERDYLSELRRALIYKPVPDMPDRELAAAITTLHPRRGVISEGVPAEQPLSVNLYVNFAYNSADLTSDARITLDRLGTALRDPRLEGFSFIIAGHTDVKGGADFNQKLSEQRAGAVRSYLIAQFRIPAERLATKGYGKSQLLDPDHPEDGVNRRVQVINTGAASQHN